MQTQEIEGEIPFDLGLYHNRHYEELMKEIRVSRQRYRDTMDMSERREIAKKEFSAWQSYIEKRRREMPEKYALTQGMVDHLSHTWSFVANRKTQEMDPKDILTFFKDYTDQYKFQPALDLRYLIQMIHPNWAYLTFMPEPLKKESFLGLLNNQLVASYERSLGQDLLADEIAAFGYWEYRHQEKGGITDLEGFLKTLRVYRFFLDDLQSFKKEFEFLLKDRKSKRSPFDFRQVFLFFEGRRVG